MLGTVDYWTFNNVRVIYCRVSWKHNFDTNYKTQHGKYNHELGIASHTNENIAKEQFLTFLNQYKV